MLYVFARAYVCARVDTENYGIVDVERNDLRLIVGYWVPFFAGSFLLLLSAYLAHVEVVHQWFSCRLTTLETWVTGCLLGLGSSVLNLVELKSIHKRHKHPEYGLYTSSLGYGNASYGSFKQRV
ncbi:hypothetical protein PsorP6_014352 [Peronosclerospora sorghi]|uniref:Uncharacterized protein n=1 Tax=Peronosclerospora sorghi TaxID=230839 RepID=A0ACC0VFW7_9STRA|nr:hypothetical protein PsorP6_014352 [Peronosclerospora sorghi]